MVREREHDGPQRVRADQERLHPEDGRRDHRACEDRQRREDDDAARAVSKDQPAFKRSQRVVAEGFSRFTLKMRSGFSLPFEFAGGSSSTSKRLPSRASVVSLTMICPASAMPQRRALVFAVSPMTV